MTSVPSGSTSAVGVVPGVPAGATVTHAFTKTHTGEKVDEVAGAIWATRSFAFTAVSIARTRTIFGTVLCIGGPSEFISNASFASLLTIDGFLRIAPSSAPLRQLAQEVLMASQGTTAADAPGNAGFCMANPLGDGDVCVARRTRSNLQVFRREKQDRAMTIFIPGPQPVNVQCHDVFTSTTMTFTLSGRDELPAQQAPPQQQGPLGDVPIPGGDARRANADDVIWPVRQASLTIPMPRKTAPSDDLTPGVPAPNGRPALPSIAVDSAGLPIVPAGGASQQPMTLNGDRFTATIPVAGGPAPVTGLPSNGAQTLGASSFPTRAPSAGGANQGASVNPAAPESCST